MASSVMACAQGLGAGAAENSGDRSELRRFVGWLLDDGERLESVRFADVVEAVSGHELLSVDAEDPVDARLLEALTEAVRGSFAAFEDPKHPIHGEGRVNEISGHLEDELHSRLDAMEGLRCGVPVNASGEPQRSGYPDLRLVDEASGRVFYLDPKIYGDGSEDSSFRTFYFEPKKETNKILDDASHVIVAAAHGGKVDGRWRLLRWQLVDLSEFRVRLKAEFQASNRDLYRPEALLRGSE
ncbi:MAG: hypothetical protein ACLFVC_06905 [Opitutales bacterium]